MNEEAGEGSSMKKQKPNSSYSGGALDGVLSTYTVQLEDQLTDDPLRLLKDSVMTFADRIVTAVDEKNAIKFYFSLHLNFHLNTDESFVTDPPIVLNSDTEEVLRTSDIDAIL